MYNRSVLIFILLICLHSGTCSSINRNIVFENVERSIDLTSQLVKILTTITIGNSDSSAIKNVVWTIDKDHSHNISFFSARDSSKHELNINEIKLENAREGKHFNIQLEKPITQKRFSLVVEEIYSGMLPPYPAEITQKDRQLVRYFGNHYLYTCYDVNQQFTKVHVRTKNIENYTKLKPVTVADGIISYGPYKSIKPFTTDRMIIHYENNAPFLIVTSMKRSIQVSHWGNIAIEEFINLLHAGAVLKGSFSRYDYQRENNGVNSIKYFKTILPASAENPYYRDFNGNISTSNMRIKRDSVELDLRPRFPLFGGWKTCYSLGYNVPSYQYLFHKGNEYLLKIRLLDHVFDDMVVEKLETTIVLPFGATNIQLKTPYEVKRLPDTVMYKYLDPEGRPVISFTKANLIENHIQDLELRYLWSPVSMIYEPILLSAALYALFLCIIVYVRLDFSIYNSENKNP